MSTADRVAQANDVCPADHCRYATTGNRVDGGRLGVHRIMRAPPLHVPAPPLLQSTLGKTPTHGPEGVGDFDGHLGIYRRDGGELHSRPFG
jgi:hypothetical protein